MGKYKCCCGCCLELGNLPTQVKLFPNSSFVDPITLTGFWASMGAESCCYYFTSNPISVPGLTEFDMCEEDAEVSFTSVCRERGYVLDFFDLPISTDCTAVGSTPYQEFYNRTETYEGEANYNFKYHVPNMVVLIYLTKREVTIDYEPVCKWFVTVRLLSYNHTIGYRFASGYTRDRVGTIDPDVDACIGSVGRFVGADFTNFGIPLPDTCPGLFPGTGPAPDIIRSKDFISRPDQFLMVAGDESEQLLAPCMLANDDVEIFTNTGSLSWCPYESPFCSPPDLPSGPAAPANVTFTRIVTPTTYTLCLGAGGFIGIDRSTETDCVLGTNVTSGFPVQRYNAFLGAVQFQSWRQSHTVHSCSSHGPFTINRPTFGIEFVW